MCLLEKLIWEHLLLIGKHSSFLLFSRRALLGQLALDYSTNHAKQGLPFLCELQTENSARSSRGVSKDSRALWEIGTFCAARF
jgi:hypothetical protein